MQRRPQDEVASAEVVARFALVSVAP